MVLCPVFTFFIATWQLTVHPSWVCVIPVFKPTESKLFFLPPSIIKKCLLLIQCSVLNVLTEIGIRLVYKVSVWLELSQRGSCYVVKAKRFKLLQTNVVGFFSTHNHFWICCLHPLPVVLISCAVYFPFALSLLCLISDTVRDGAAQEMVKQLVGKWDNTKWWIMWKKAKSACDLYPVGELFLVKTLNSAGLHKTNLIGKKPMEKSCKVCLKHKAVC